MSQFQNDLRTKLVTYTGLIGHPLTPGEMEGLLGVIRRVILTDSGTAVSHCTTDATVFPDSKV